MTERFVVQVYCGKNEGLVEDILTEEGVNIWESFIAYGHLGCYVSIDTFFRCKVDDEGELHRIRALLKEAEYGEAGRRVGDFDVLREHESFDECTRFNELDDRVSQVGPCRGESIPRQVKF